MKKTGIKFYSDNFVTNLTQIREIRDLFDKESISFVEIYAVPNTFKDVGQGLKTLFDRVPVFIHAPSFCHGFNPSDKDLASQNNRLYDEARRYADLFESTQIVTCAGVGHSLPALEEAGQQLKILNKDDNRMVIENMPPFSDDQKQNRMNGCFALDLVSLMSDANASFLLDVGHACCMASYMKMDAVVFVKQLLEVKPIRVRISDGDVASTKNDRLHLGAGNYPLSDIIKLIKELPITLETGNSETKVKSYVSDLNFLKTL